MARMPNGILGGLVGRVGQVSGLLRLGVPVLRSKPRPKSYKRTPAREAKPLRLKVIRRSLKPLPVWGFQQKISAKWWYEDRVNPSTISNGFKRPSFSFAVGGPCAVLSWQPPGRTPNIPGPVSVYHDQ